MCSLCRLDSYVKARWVTWWHNYDGSKNDHIMSHFSHLLAGFLLRNAGLRNEGTSNVFYLFNFEFNYVYRHEGERRIYYVFMWQSSVIK